MKDMTDKKPITLDDLAELMQAQFGGVNTRLDGVDKRLDSVDGQLSDMSTRISRLDARTESLNRDITKLYSSVLKLEFNLRDNNDELSKVKDGLGKVLTNLDAYAKKEDTNTTEQVALSSQVDRLQLWVEKIAKKTGVDLSSIKS